ncbi:protein nervous wreck-like [Tachypleus tridentatus]|uniref:protein nervous wreck-like n=1 Tax=Tachypleus tridentatus TaxID=6853 RepID=UPI003FD6572D
MQPPPRKAKAVSNLRNIHNEQITKLQSKHQQDADLLEDIRNFMKTRANIEKEYGLALSKLANINLQRKVNPFAEVKSGYDDQQRTVYTIWKTLLDETDKIAQAKLAAVDVYQEVSEKAKALRNNKLQVSKRCFDNIRKMHEELQQSVQEVDKTRKLYFEEEHMAHGAREKAHDAEEKLKRKKGRIFQSISSLQRNSAKFSLKKEAYDIQATKARNDYILALVAANAHLYRFYNIDLADVIQNLDCDIYDKIKEYIQLVSRTELLTCAAWQSSFTNLQRESESKHEELNRLHSESIGKEKSSVSSSGEKTAAEIDPEIKIEELRQLIRKAETGKAKAEARIEAFREGKVNVEEFLKNADVDSFGLHNNLSRTGSKTSKSSQKSEVSEQSCSKANDYVYDSDLADGLSDVLTQSQPFEGTGSVDIKISSEKEVVVEATINVWDATSEESVGPIVNSKEEEGMETVTETIAHETEPLSEMNIRCTALYGYEAANPDELSFLEQEELWIIGEGDGDGWVKARNYRNEEGYIPQNYVEITDGQNLVSSIFMAPSLVAFVDYSQSNKPGEGFVSESSVPGAEINDSLQLPCDKFCQALYDYEATCDEELTFMEGQIIRILKKVVHDVDDGWWEGEVDGNIGIFPSLVVKEIKTSGESQTPSDLATPTDSAPPPAYTPPKPQLLLPPAQVILTQPTPEAETVEDGIGTQSKVSVLYRDPDFQLELSKGQQQQYSSQFSISESESSEQEIPASSSGGGDYVPLTSSPDSPPRPAENEEFCQKSSESDKHELEKVFQQPTIVVEDVGSDDETTKEDTDQSKCSRKEDSPPVDLDDVTNSSAFTDRSSEDYDNILQNGDSRSTETELTHSSEKIVPEKGTENGITDKPANISNVDTEKD